MKLSIFTLKDILPYININNQMPDYKNTKIYTIRWRDDTSLIYVGSTTQKLSQRWTDHKKNAKNPNQHDYTMKVYQTMRDKGHDNFYIELYEDFSCDNKEQVAKREGEIIRLIGTLNKQIAGRTLNQYKEETREYKNEYMRQYHTEHKEERSIYNKQYREENKEILKSKKKGI